MAVCVPGRKQTVSLLDNPANHHRDGAVSDLVTFLRERLAEEQDAAEGTQPGPWIAVPAPMPGEVEVRHQMPDGRPDVSAAVATTHGLRCAEQDADHIARYNPARILAEVAVKRALLKWCTYPDTGGGPDLSDHQDDVLRMIGGAYDWHPEYRSEWML